MPVRSSEKKRTILPFFCFVHQWMGYFSQKTKGTVKWVFFWKKGSFEKKSFGKRPIFTLE